MGIKIEFNCSKCGEKVLDTRFTKEHDGVTLALSPWLSMCTKHEKAYFDSKKLDGYTAEKLQKNVTELIEESQPRSAIAEGAIVKIDTYEQSFAPMTADEEYAAHKAGKFATEGEE